MHQPDMTFAHASTRSRLDRSHSNHYIVEQFDWHVTRRSWSGRKPRVPDHRTVLFTLRVPHYLSVSGLGLQPDIRKHPD
eukprot:5069823-Pyramimonas_sp.AAC.1